MSTVIGNLVGIRNLLDKANLVQFLEDTARFYGSRVLVLDPALEPVARLNDPEETLDPTRLPLRREANAWMIDGPGVHAVDVYGHTVGFLCAEPISAGDGHAAEALCRHAAGILSELGVKEYELNDLSQEILDSYEEVNLFYGISSAVGTVRDVEAICTVILEKVCEIIRVNRASILLTDEKAGELYVAAAVGIPAEERSRIRIPVGEGISGQVMESRTARLVDDVGNLPHGMLSGFESYATSSFISVPLLVERGAGVSVGVGAVAVPDGKAIGVINMTDKKGDESFTSGDLKLLTALSHQAAVLIENTRLIELEKELRIARDIQQGLLPDSPPVVAGLELAGTCQPATNVGGDYYDFVWREQDGNLAVVIADVSGHNVASALMMAVARSALRSEFRATGDPGTVLERANGFLYEDLTRAELFLSILCMVYEPEGRTLRYSSAGHNPALLFRPGERSCRILDADGLLAGVLDGMTYPTEELELREGDVVMLYTDGLVEAVNGSGEMFGLARLADVFRLAAQRPSREILDRVFAAVYRFSGDRSGADDMTMVVLKVTGGQDR
ncbi:MAG: GAF domain-containing SpoIIE family protein phosphatase [Planctomycetota bacterium]